MALAPGADQLAVQGVQLVGVFDGRGLVESGEGENEDVRDDEARQRLVGDDRGDPVIQLSPPLTADQSTFDEIESIIRRVLDEAWKQI